MKPVKAQEDCQWFEKLVQRDLLGTHVPTEPHSPPEPAAPKNQHNQSAPFRQFLAALPRVINPNISPFWSPLVAMTLNHCRKERTTRGRGMSFFQNQNLSCDKNVTDWHDAIVGDQVTPIDMLNDDVLLEIFDFYVTSYRYGMSKRVIEMWQPLVHVCRRWRCVVFGSPRRLNLRLVCTPGTPARKYLDVWPPLPLVVDALGTISTAMSVDNVLVALGHQDRVCRIDLRIVRGLEWDKVLAAMQVPFPALTHLNLWENLLDRESVITSGFLGGSAPRLQSLKMARVPFLGIPNLLFSATHLVHLGLHDIPDSGYISPGAMASSLTVLTSLKTLILEFLCPRSRPDWESQPPPPMTCSILPFLDKFWFKGASEYLDVLVAWIDAPQIHFLRITFFPQTNYDTPHLVQFISRTLSFQEPNGAQVSLGRNPNVRLLWESDNCGRLSVGISGTCSDPHPLSGAQACTMCLPPLLTVENLRLETLYSGLKWKHNVVNGQWLELLHPFSAVKSLYLYKELQSNMAAALQELVGDRTTEVLPSLRNIFLEECKSSGSFHETIGQFIAARKISGLPIAVLPM